MNRSSKGFTLLELLIVIAILGVLMAILLYYLGDARSKGSDASIQSNLVNARAQAELYFNLNGLSYMDVCTESLSDSPQGIADFVEASDFENGSGEVNCFDNDDDWALEVQLNNDTAQYLCVHTGGEMGVYTESTIAGGDLECGS